MTEPASDALLDAYGDDDIDWRGDPPDHREGCYWSFDGRIKVHVGNAEEPATLVAQRRAGEEDQSSGAPEWGA